MKLQKVFKNILRILVFAGMMCILPVFSDEVKADQYVTVWKSDETEAVPDVDYAIVTDDYQVTYLLLKRNDLIIEHSDYPIKDDCGDTGPHTYTIRNLNIKTNPSGGAALNFANNSKDVLLYVDGNCIISGQGTNPTTGISSKGSLKILPKPNGGSHSLTIQGVNEGIWFSAEANASLILGDDNGHINIKISSKRALLGAEMSDDRGPLIINKGVSLNCSGGEGVSGGLALVDNFSSYDINGTVKLECNSDSCGAIKLYGDSAGSFKVGPYADIYLTSKG